MASTGPPCTQGVAFQVLFDHVDNNFKELHPVLQDFKELIEGGHTCVSASFHPCSNRYQRRSLTARIPRAIVQIRGP